MRRVVLSTLPTRRRALAVAALLALGSASGCYKFTGGTFPQDIKTIAILPFENETTRLELTQELSNVLRDVPNALGVRPASEELANAVLRGRITNYVTETPTYTGNATTGTAVVLQRQVTIVLTVELVDRLRNEILWESSGVSGVGQYLEASETEDVGMRLALKQIRQKILDGAQSNW
jgi:hypothetical protein